MPKRIQRKRTKGWKMPPNTVYVGRPSRWGNPVKVGDAAPFDGIVETVEEALGLYQDLLNWQIEGGDDDFLEPLRGKNLACWCKEDDPCHADILLELANK